MPYLLIPTGTIYYTEGGGGGIIELPDLKKRKAMLELTQRWVHRIMGEGYIIVVEEEDGSREGAINYQRGRHRTEKGGVNIILFFLFFVVT